ncbi:internalin [Cecembia lonarensis]|uniref:Leucine Rich repeats (2 copies) n=1 Tax=Cecembia lonarensis (strain CCUG 58316 / KCTC 22772 / LW9) TaxID=1225176 RepID=K1L9A3_CECL9|nr:internalin [Cecembia lonarensis]EKB51216.1 Leucine Rich repeats (2 copies) [Cecembia lonarensis LW9]
MMKHFTFMEKLTKSFLTLGLVLFVFTACQDDDDPTPPVTDPADEVIAIEDSELLEIIMEELNINNPENLTKGRMMQLTELNISNSVVSSFSGLEEAENLEVLLARSVEVSDLSPISSLENLVQIDMRDALMPTTLSFLAPLEKLENIDFQNTAVADISALQGKTTLTHINLRETDVTDISALEGMTQLLFLNLNRAGGGNGITNPEITIPMDKLYYLSLRNTEVGDELMAEIFANKTQMVESNLRNTGITDISFLVPVFEAGAFTQALSDQYGNKISLDLQNNAITNLCVIAPWVDNFPEGELEWSAVAGDFDNCD